MDPKKHTSVTTNNLNLMDLAELAFKMWIANHIAGRTKGKSKAEKAQEVMNRVLSLCREKMEGFPLPKIRVEFDKNGRDSLNVSWVSIEELKEALLLYLGPLVAKDTSISAAIEALVSKVFVIIGTLEIEDGMELYAFEFTPYAVEILKEALLEFVKGLIPVDSGSAANNTNAEENKNETSEKKIQ